VLPVAYIASVILVWLCVYVVPRNYLPPVVWWAVGPYQCQSCLCWTYILFPSQWNNCGASIPLSIAFRSCCYRPLSRHFCVVSFGFVCS
jgi:hypothetical protein